MSAFVIALLGAESTGKTELAERLSERIAQETGLHCTWVPEVLRQWCANAGRTPQAHEQAGIAHLQHDLIEQAAARHDVVVSDTTGLMTSTYSRYIFQDASLEAMAVAWHREHVHATLLTALDLPWQPDGIQRDGPQVRGPVDDELRALLQRHALPWALVSGEGQARVQSALDAVGPALRGRPAPRAGLLTRLQQRDAAAGPAWFCADCDDPACEHLSRLLRASSGQNFL